MPSSRPTADELVAALKRSRLKTVMVEGTDDPLIYRRLERILGDLNVDFLPCGGRGTLLEVYARRGELPSSSACFIADQDMWVFTGIPVGHEDLICTKGYSIENDVYHDSRVETLLEFNDVPNHQQIISELARWFAFQVQEFRAGREFRTDPHLPTLIPLPGVVCSPAELSRQGYQQADTDLEAELRTEYKLKFRGKVLFEVLVRFSHAPNRTRYSYDALVNFAVISAAEGPLIGRIVGLIRQQLYPPATSQN